ncbi:MAG: hypothetical protein FWD90_00570 [Defluviitaleaceae bacterium]|nr:hypothetical protein [Defluviitaleaceae bacterium]
MNFEEKVLAMLENENNAINGLKTDISRLNQTVAVIELEHGKSLGALHDGYKLLYDEVTRMRPVVEATANDVETIKSVVTRHSGIFSALKSAI